MLLERVRERGLGLADLSRALKKNDAYMHQFIWRGSPEWLGEADRAIVCRMIDIPEAVLRPPMVDPGLSMRGAPSSGPVESMDLRDVPVFREDAEISLASAQEWAHRLPGWGTGASIALWITSEHGRFSPGDLIYIHQRQPPRVGDHVVAFAERRIAAIGRIVNMDRSGQFMIQDQAERSMAIPDGATVYKVAAAIYA